MVYSVDLRKRAVEAVQQGMTLIQAEKTFKVTRKAIGKWIKRLEKMVTLILKLVIKKGIVIKLLIGYYLKNLQMKINI